jgi:predicted DNA-binding transcriptional regulator AlpA
MPIELPTNPDLSSEVAALKRQVAQLLRLLGQTDAYNQALSISQFCARNNISRSFFYKLKKNGKAPRIMEVAGRRIISPEAERDWRVERERDAIEAAGRVSFDAAQLTNQGDLTPVHKQGTNLLKNKRRM